MAKNFIIFYSGREGSSAIISTLSAQPEINVPLFEDLEQWVLGEEYSSSRVAELLNEMWSTGYSPVSQAKLDRLFAKDDAGRSAAQSIGLKLRPPPDLTQLIEVMKRNDVQPFVLIRSDLAESVASEYLSRMATFAGDHAMYPQFAKIEQSEEIWQRYKSDWNQRRATASALRIRSLLHSRARVVRKHVKIARQLNKRGFQPYVIRYSDYVTDATSLIVRIKASLDIVSAGAPSVASKFERVNEVPARDRVAGLDRAMKHPICLLSRMQFAAALRKLEAIAPPLMR